jgi:hypothetical protein
MRLWLRVGLWQLWQYRLGSASADVSVSEYRLGPAKLHVIFLLFYRPAGFEPRVRRAGTMFPTRDCREAARRRSAAEVSTGGTLPGQARETRGCLLSSWGRREVAPGPRAECAGVVRLARRIARSRFALGEVPAAGGGRVRMLNLWRTRERARRRGWLGTFERAGRRGGRGGWRGVRQGRR